MSPAPITFTTKERGHVEAFLDGNLIGTISPFPSSGKAFGSATHVWRHLLPDNCGGKMQLRPASSLQSAKRLMLNAIADWHKKADETRHRQMVLDLRAQADAVWG